MPNALAIPAVSPEDWGARQDYDNWGHPYSQDDKAIFHWLGGWNTSYASKTDEEMMAMVEGWHIDGRGWKGIGYGWAMNPTTGRVLRGRGFNTYAAHRGDLDADGLHENAEAIPILLLTGKGGPELTTKGKSSLQALVHALAAEVGKDRLPTYGHRDVALMGWGTSTSCPGDSIHAFAKGLRLGSLPPMEDEDAALVAPWRELHVHLDDDGDPTYEAFRADPELRHHARIWQATMAALGYKASNTFDGMCAADGLFGPGTRRITITFQRDRGITADGVVGPVSWLEGLKAA